MVIKELITQNFSIKELKAHPIETIRKWFWNSPQITTWTFMFLEKRLSRSSSTDFIAIRDRLERISTSGITFSKKVKCSDRLPEYWEKTLICYTSDNLGIEELGVAQLVNTREFQLTSGSTILISSVIYWRE